MQQGIITGILFLLTFGLFLLYQWKKTGVKGEDAIALAFKGGATLCCTALAVYGAAMNQQTGFWFLAIGLFVCTLADVLLGIHFLTGMGCFALGHIFYCIACFSISPPRLPSVVAFLLLMLGVLAIIPWIKRHNDGRNIVPFIAYGVVLCVMLSFAVAQRPILLIGAVLFVVSDVMLGYRIATDKKSKRYDYACLGCYYLAQFLIGASAVF